MLVHAVWMFYRNQLIYYSADTAYLSIGFANFFRKFFTSAQNVKKGPSRVPFQALFGNFRAGNDRLRRTGEFFASIRRVDSLGFIRFVYLLSIPVQQHQTGEIACLHSTVGQTVNLGRSLTHAVNKLHRRELSGLDKVSIAHRERGFQAGDAGRRLCELAGLLLGGVRCMVGCHHVDGAVL